MKKILLLLITLFVFTTILPAKMVDGIAMIVEGEAITTAEIRAVQTQLGIPKNKAIDLLIQDRLQKSSMKDILIDETLIDQKIESIAAQNHVSIKKMQKILKQSGTPWVKYRASIKDALKKEKFYQEKIITSIPAPSTDELKLYYNSHKKEFTLPSRINMVEYTAKDKATIDKFLKTHKQKYVSAKKIQKATKSIDETLLSMLLSTPNGGYTQAINAGDKYIVYKVISKTGKIPMSFELAQNAVDARWKQAQQQKALKDYFEKLRTRADIQILR